MKQTLLIFDLDDTLIVTYPEFEKTNLACATYIASCIDDEHLKLDAILKKQRQFDLEMVTAYGFLRPRYLNSWLQTCEVIFNTYNKQLTKEVLSHITDIVEDIYVRPYALAPHAIEVLMQLKSEGYRMIVLTAGEQDVQRLRVNQSGVDAFMDAIYVYPKKTPDTFKEVIDLYPNMTYCMIGNSLKSDIHPALHNQAWGIHIIVNTWEADAHPIDTLDPYYRQINQLNELPQLLNTIRNRPLI